METTYRAFVRYYFGRRNELGVQRWRMLYQTQITAILRSERTLRQLTPFLHVRLWVDGEAFPRIAKLLSRARRTIFIQMFIWRDDEIGRRIATVLLERADAGVRVTINKEAIGDVFEFHSDFLATKYEDEPLWRRFWSHPNIRIHYTTNNDHAKVYVIDGNVLLLTGMNIANEYHYELHDYLVELRGERFVERYLSGGDIPNEPGRVELRLNSPSHKEMRPTFLRLLNEARESIVLEHCYISDPEIVQTLIRRSHEGVRVTLITPARTEFLHRFANMDTVARLVAEGSKKTMRVFLYPAKSLLVDHRVAFVGSANLMTSSLDEMGEVNVLLTGANQRALMKLREGLRMNILKSRLVTSPPRLRWLVRWLAWFNL